MKIMIVNDPTRKGDDPSYLCDKFELLAPGDGDEILTLRGYDAVVDFLHGYSFLDDCNITWAPADFHNFKEYAQNCDYLLIMPSALQDGITGALINAFTRYNSVANIYTF